MSSASKNKIPVILLFGPTAVGKTELIHSLFRPDFEIINTDSQQVYRYLDIATAKPSEDLRSAIPHHLVDIVSPKEQYDLGRFVRDADRLVREIRQRNKVPVLAGGTAFYFYHFIFGLPESPQVEPKAREALEKRLRREGVAALYSELEQKDPDSAGHIHPNDTQRVLRALEVLYSSGRPLSAYSVPRIPRGEYRFLTLGLFRDRGELYQRINQRVSEMWQEGLPDEFRRLLDMGFREEDPGMKGIGYREFFLMRRAGEFLFSHIQDEIRKNSRRYAKRQITFFKRIPGVEWFHPDETPKIQERIRKFLQSNTE